METSELRRRRLYAGYNMSEVARHANVSPGTVKRVEEGGGNRDSRAVVTAVIDRLYADAKAKYPDSEPPWYRALVEGQSPP